MQWEKHVKWHGSSPIVMHVTNESNMLVNYLNISRWTSLEGMKQKIKIAIENKKKDRSLMTMTSSIMNPIIY